MLGWTPWNPTPGSDLHAHNGMEQQAGRCLFHSGRTQMAVKHSSACTTGLCSTKLKSSWFSFISVCCWKEVEPWNLYNISHQNKLTTRRVRRELESTTCHHFRVKAKGEEDKVLSKASSIVPARHSWDDRNSRVRHTTSPKTAWNVLAYSAKRIAFIILDIILLHFFFFSASSTL